MFFYDCIYLSLHGGLWCHLLFSTDHLSERQSKFSSDFWLREILRCLERWYIMKNDYICVCVCAYMYLCKYNQHYLQWLKWSHLKRDGKSLLIKAVGNKRAFAGICLLVWSLCFCWNNVGSIFRTINGLSVLQTLSSVYCVGYSVQLFVSGWCWRPCLCRH